MDGIRHDLRVALRMIRSKPGFSFAVMGMLALGVAGNAAIFSIFNGLFLRPLSFAEPQRLVDLDETAPKWNLERVGIATPDFVAWQKGNTTFESMADFGFGSANLTTAGTAAQRVSTADVTWNLLDVLGLKPAAGRTFRPEEDRPRAERVVMLGYDVWQRLYAGDRTAVGQVLRFDDQPYTIVGVLPREAVIPAVDVWRPLAADPDKHTGWSYSGIGRLKPGVTREQARADLLRIHRTVIITGKDVNEITSPIVGSLRERYLGNFQTAARILLGAVAVVLLIACVNIAGLMLVRGESRSRELAIRAALGASRARVIRQLLTESALMAAIGGVAGIGLGKVFLAGLVSLMSGNVPKWVRFDLDWRFALFCIAATAAAAMLFGLAPALQAAAVEARGCLQETARSTLTRGKRRVLGALVVGEIALALMLLTGSGLLLQAFRKVMQTSPGFRPDNVITFSVRLPGPKYPKPSVRLAFFRNLVERLKVIPGAATVSAASIVPLGGHQGTFFIAEGSKFGPDEKTPVTLRIAVLPGYLETMGITLLGGRGFDERDQLPESPKVVIVNASFANYYWGTTDVVGKRIRYPDSGSGWMSVAGVIGDTRHYGLDGVMRPSVWVTYSGNPGPAMTIAIRGAADARALTAPARDILRQLDADLPMYDVRTMTERLERSLWVRRAYSLLFAVFAGVAMLLAAAGIYSVISFAVSRRTREIGIRMALGARPGQVLQGVLRSGMMLVAAGLVIGLGATLFATRWIETMLFGISPRNLSIYLGTIVGVAAVGLLANFVPARRAARVDPMRALRAD